MAMKGWDEFEIGALLRSFDGKVDNQGLAPIYKNIALESNAPGLLKATFLTKAYENGGDFSTDVISKDLAPYSSFVGLKSTI